MARFLSCQFAILACVAGVLGTPIPEGIVPTIGPASAWGQSVSESQSSDDAFFQSSVAPLLAKRCLHCHSHASEIEGGLALDFASGWKQGGNRGPAIIPGNTEQSLLLQVIDGRHPELVMPPDERLSADEIATLTSWIARGAFDSRVSAPAPKSNEPWWSLEPIADPLPPSPIQGEGDWTVNHPIDAFLQQSMQQQGLKPSPPAPRRVLARRLYVDLHGLLPSADEVDEVEQIDAPEWYEREVDALLASPAYGERWARHWFDWIHFADSHGFEHDVMRMHAWRYRDYVIRSLNEDTPWPDWVRQQLAADVLYPNQPELKAALGFLAAGPWDQSTAATAQTTFDYLDRDDMVTQTCSVLLSTTVHCARCHHHKFDPIPQSDYYAFQAVLAGVGRGNVPFDEDAGLAERRAALQAWGTAARHKDPDTLLSNDARALVERWEASRNEVLVSWSAFPTSIVLSSSGSTLTTQGEDIVVSGARPETDSYLHIADFEDSVVTGIRLDVLRDDALPMSGPGRNDNGNFHLNEIVVEHVPAGSAIATPVALSRAVSDFDQEGWGIAQALDGNTKTAWGIYPEIGKDHVAVFAFAKSQTMSKGDRLVVHLRQLHGGFHTIGRYRLSVTSDRDPTSSLVPHQVASVLRVPKEERSASQQLELAAYVVGQYAEQETKRLPSPAYVYGAAPTFEPLPQSEFYKPWSVPKSVFVLKRGDIGTPMEKAAPGALSALRHLQTCFSSMGQDSNRDPRAALADWITHEENPLFWRSIVNRLWLHHFGQGLVDTPNDFGRMGSLPTHPELLDWLANELRRTRSLKHIHRLIVTSAAYQRSSVADPATVAKDPANRYLARSTRRRLEAEVYRDSLLHLSATLDRSMGGPSVLWFRLGPAIQVTPSVDYRQFDWNTRDGNRRAIYRFVYRGQQDPLMEMLDFPDAAQLTPARSTTSSPLQALALWNHEFVLYGVSRLQKQFEAHASSDVVRDLYRSLFSRDPTVEEWQMATDHLKENSLASLIRVLVNSSEFLYVD